ncbi:MAG: glycosyltransferase family 2 protein [Propionibacteriaceae bacterium]|jgi:cellulose synthase/poly-beta-1,6-N-acetylglucosamine synthase-like glycosyltransferase|nr:glycosyltransferase family 2 protein [Propionibacteriaceae bacterium]
MLAGIWIACQILGLAGIALGLYQVWLVLPPAVRSTRSVARSDRRHRLAVLVFARDEALVIGDLLDSLAAQNYPRELFDVYVTADNCTDSTAAIARRHGAVVWERHDLANVGKGFALRWFFERFTPKHGSDYDACVVFDADNLAEPGFLKAMNQRLNQGDDLAVGYRMGKNPTSSWIAGVTTLFWLLQTRFAYRPRARRGISCLSVGGTGFMFRMSALDHGQWNTSSVAEDIEFTLETIARGGHVGLAADAVFYDEQPLTLRASLRQRYRWTVGALQSNLIAWPKLKKSKAVHGLARFDALVSCSALIIAAVSPMIGLLGGVAGLLWWRNWLTAGWLGLAMFLLAYAITAAIGWLALYLEHETWPGAWKAVLAFPLFMITWVALYVIVLFHRSTVWHAVPHVDARNIEQLQQRRSPQALSAEPPQLTDDPQRAPLRPAVPALNAVSAMPPVAARPTTPRATAMPAWATAQSGRSLRQPLH